MSTAIAALNSSSIRYAEFIQINIGTIGSPTAVYTFCNAASNVTINGILFQGMGAYVGLSEIQQDMKSTSVDLKLTVTGLNPDIIAAVLAANMKGSQIIVWRGFLDSNNQIQTIGGVQQFFQRYQGIINNIAISEKFELKPIHPIGGFYIPMIQAWIECQSLHPLTSILALSQQLAVYPK